MNSSRHRWCSKGPLAPGGCLVLLSLLGVLLLPAIGAASVEFSRLSRPDDLRLTVYQSADLTLVTEHRRVNLEAGKNRVRFRWQTPSVDPSSVSLNLDAGGGSVRVLEQTFPPGAARESVWVLEADQAGRVPLTIHYFLAGINVDLSYWGTLIQNGFEIRLQGRADLQNQTEQEFERAGVTVLVGEIQLLEDLAQRLDRWREFQSPGRNDEAISRDTGRGSYERARAVMQKSVAADAPSAGAVRALTDYWLLDLGSGVRLDSRSTTSRWFLPSRTVDVKSRYRVHTGTQRGTKQYLLFTNKPGPRGDTSPLPEGSLRLRYRDSQGRLTPRGTSQLEYTSPGETVQLELPVTRGLRSESIIKDRSHQNFEFDERGNRTGHDVVTVRRTRLENTRNRPITVNLHHHFEDQYWRLEEATTPYERVNYREVAFTRRLDPGEVETVTLVIRQFEGSRRDSS